MAHHTPVSTAWSISRAPATEPIRYACPVHSSTFACQTGCAIVAALCAHDMRSGKFAFGLRLSYHDDN